MGYIKRLRYLGEFWVYQLSISSRNELPQARGMVNGEKATSALDALMHFDHRSCKPEMPERLHKMNEPQKTSH